MNAGKPWRDRAVEIAYFSTFLLIAIFAYQLPANAWFTAIPGDLIDARFNSIILEHVYQWVSGEEESLWSPGFFYPVADVLALSDNHFGSVVFYVLARWLGLEREPAMSVWLMIGGLLNYTTTYYALRKLGLRPLAAGGGAFVFAFSLPVLAQQGHAQFSYRLFVPLAFLCFYRWLETGKTAQLAWTALWVAAQFYCAIYTGVFCLYLLLAMAVAWGALGRARALWGQVRTGNTRLEQVVGLAVIAACGLATLGLLAKYHAVSSAHAFSRPREEIFSMLPRVRSYLLADFSQLSNWVGGRWGNMPMRHEHQLFIGLGAAFFILLGALAVLRRFEHEQVGKVALLSVLLIVACTISVGGITLYTVFLHFPGIDSIRAVTRVMLVLVFPLGLLAGVGIERWVLVFARRGAAWAGIGGISAIALLVLETCFFYKFQEPVSAWHKRQQDFAARVPAGTKPDSVLYADKSLDAPYLDDLDAMIYAQDHKMVTANGYSGYVPPGAGVGRSCESPESYLQAQVKHARVDQALLQQLRERIVVVPKQQCEGGRVVRFAGRVPVEIARNLRITIVSVVAESGKLHAKVNLHNGSGLDFSTLEMEGRNVRLSWRLVPRGQESSPPGWDARKDLSLLLLPDQSSEVEFVAMAAPGEYTLEVNLVQEMVFWFNDEGMQVPSIAVVI